MLVVILVLAVLTPGLLGQAPATGFPGKSNGEWASYNSDIMGSRYMPFDQINASNFNQLLGRYRGTLVTAAGETIRIDNLLGYAESHYAKW